MKTASMKRLRMIPVIRQYGRGKTTDTVKTSVVTRTLEERNKDCKGEASFLFICLFYGSETILYDTRHHVFFKTYRTL